MTLYFRKAVSLCCCILTLTILQVKAQYLDPVQLKTLIDSAEKNFPSLQQKKSIIESTEASNQFLKHSLLPTTIIGDELLVASDNSLAGSYLSMGVIPSTSGGIRSENTSQAATGNFGFITSQYNLIDFGYRKARLKTGDALLGINKADYSREFYLLKWQLSKLYFNMLKSYYQLGIEAANVKRNAKIYSVIRALTLSGIKPGADSSLSLAELSKSKLNYNQTAQQFARLKSQVIYLSGIQEDNIALDTTNIPDSLRQFSPANLFPDVAAGNPVLQYYQQQKAYLQANQNLIRKTYQPNVSLTGSLWARGSSIEYNNNFKPLYEGLGYQRYNYFIGLSLTYNILNPLLKKDRLKVAGYDYDAANYELLQQTQYLDNIGQQADISINTSKANLNELPVQIKAADDVFLQKSAQYKAGIINLIDLTNASYILYRAQSDYIQTVNDWYIASIDKAASTGNLDVFLQSLKN
jgi:outer membrane protein TolC